MKKLDKFIYVFVLVFSVQNLLYGQNISKSNETILNLSLIDMDNNFGSFVGFQNENPAFVFYNSNQDSNEIFVEYFSEQLKEFEETDFHFNFLKRRTGFYNFYNNIFFFKKIYFESPNDYGYSNIFLYDGKDRFLLDSINNADKKIHSSFSTDGQLLLVNTLNTLSDYYNPEQDNRITVFDLSEIENGQIEKDYIRCNKCSDSYLIGDQLFFTIGRKDGYDGYSNKDIYVAPWGKLEDSVKIASNTNILSISPDGKFILGTRFWDRQKNTAVIVDVETKKYQMVLGRDYAKHKSFYSSYENKFVFDYKDHLIYINFPKSYPFDALKWRNDEIPDWTDEEFWKQYQHEPLPDK